MLIPRGGVAVTTYGNLEKPDLLLKRSLENHLYAIGGNSGTSSLDSCERYDPICLYLLFNFTMEKLKFSGQMDSHSKDGK